MVKNTVKKDKSLIKNWTIQELTDFLKQHNRYYYLPIGHRQNKQKLIDEILRFYKQQNGIIEQNKEAFKFIPKKPQKKKKIKLAPDDDIELLKFLTNKFHNFIVKNEKRTTKLTAYEQVPISNLLHKIFKTLANAIPNDYSNDSYIIEKFYKDFDGNLEEFKDELKYDVDDAIEISDIMNNFNIDYKNYLHIFGKKYVSIPKIDDISRNYEHLLDILNYITNNNYIKKVLENLKKRQDNKVESIIDNINMLTLENPPKYMKYNISTLTTNIKNNLLIPYFKKGYDYLYPAIEEYKKAHNTSRIFRKRMNKELNIPLNDKYDVVDYKF